MSAAEELLKAQKPKEALAPEQRALKLLQDAEQAYELEVRQQQAGGGGGGGGGGGSRWPRSWPTCSSCSSTAWPISTRLQQRADSSRRRSRSTSWPSG